MLANTLDTRPRRCTHFELADVGVDLLDKYGVRPACDQCGLEWSPVLRRDEWLPPGYWRYPAKCDGKPRISMRARFPASSFGAKCTLTQPSTSRSDGGIALSRQRGRFPQPNATGRET